MNKKADLQNEPIVKLILMVIVVAAILYFIVPSVWNLAKASVNIGNPLYTQINEKETVNAFNDLQTNYELCFNSKNKECLCNNIQFPLLPNNYRINIIREIISLQRTNTKDSKVWDLLASSSKPKNRFTGKNMACYLNSWDGSKNIGQISNFGSSAKSNVIEVVYNPFSLENVDIYGTIIEKYYFIGNVPRFYKKDNNNICFVLDRSSQKEVLDFDTKNYVTNKDIDIC